MEASLEERKKCKCYLMVGQYPRGSEVVGGGFTRGKKEVQVLYNGRSGVVGGGFTKGKKEVQNS